MAFELGQHSAAQPRAAVSKLNDVRIHRRSSAAAVGKTASLSTCVLENARSSPRWHETPQVRTRSDGLPRIASRTLQLGPHRAVPGEVFEDAISTTKQSRHGVSILRRDSRISARKPLKPE
jgi:hypothetical protein